MSKKIKRPVTAKEIMDEKLEDPEYAKWYEQQIEELDQDEIDRTNTFKPLVYDLGRIGYPVESIDDLLTTYAPIPIEVVDLLFEYLEKIGDDYREEIARLIGGTKIKYDGKPLTELFDSDISDGFRWAISNTISLTKPTGIEKWLKKTLLNSKYGSERQMLCTAAARILPAEEAIKALLEIFDEMPGHAADGLGRVGGKFELQFLKKFNPEKYHTWVKRAIDSAIRTIEKRLERKK